MNESTPTKLFFNLNQYNYWFRLRLVVFSSRRGSRSLQIVSDYFPNEEMEANRTAVSYKK